MAGSRATDVTPSEEKLNGADEVFCRKSADLILGWTQCPPYSIFSASTRIFSCLNHYENKEACKKFIKKYISEYIALGFNPEKLINAALIHFDFVDSLYSRKEAATANDFHIALLAALNNEKLTLYYANNLYKSCRADTSNRVPDDERYAISKWIAPDLKSRAWQDTMEKINSIALQKLKKELRGMSSVDAQAILLKLAKTWVIFNEHASNFRLTGGFGRTRPLQEIDLMLDKLRETHPGHQFRPGGYHINS